MNLPWKKSRRLKSKGASLIEMLVVMAIIAILASMMFPVFSKAIKKGPFRGPACGSE